MKEDSGFTLFELMAVILIIGILAVTAVPSWVAFINQRRINAANDVIFAALQQAQREAKRTKLSYSVSFKTDVTGPKFAVYPGITSANWESLDKGLNLKPGQLILGTNLTDTNAAGASLTYALTDNDNKQKITFDYRGVLVPTPNFGVDDQGLIVVVAVPKPDNSTQAVEATRRCVKVKSLLGAMQIGKGNECGA